MGLATEWAAECVKWRNGAFPGVVVNHAEHVSGLLPNGHAVCKQFSGSREAPVTVARPKSTDPFAPYGVGGEVF